MSETMIEHLAKALFDASVMKAYGCPFPWDGTREENRDEYRFSARVFMKALQDRCPPLFLPNAKEEDVEPVIVMAPSSHVFDFIDYATQFDGTALSQDNSSLPTPAATPTDSANPPPVESVGPNSEAQS